MIENPQAGACYPARLAELRQWFATDADCLDYLEWLRWPTGFVCPHCGNESGPRGKDGLRRCSGCRRRVSVTAGTVFQDTRTPLSVWFEAAWLMTAPKNGVSAATLAAELPIGSYQTAWTMLAKYRSSMSQQGKARLSGRVEVDEWFHGGVAKGGNAFTGKNLVVAAVETGGRGWGRARLGIVPNRGGWELRKFITANVEPGSHIVTDAHSGYLGALAGYSHEPRNESAPGAPEAHTLLPAVHRVFSLAERWLLGTHQGGVQREHLQSYLDEFAFRWNRRNADNRGLLFLRLLEHAVGAPPATYRDLVKIGATCDAKPTAPGERSLPGTLDVVPLARPWRRAHELAA